MTIGLAVINISIPDARSLKEKRAVVRSLKDRARQKMNVSVAEVGKHDVWKCAELAFATVSSDTQRVHQQLSAITSFVRSDPRLVLLDVHTETL